jgi:hypothetical protein
VTTALAVLAASPIVVGAFTLVGDTWYPMSDWSSAALRTSQVGSWDTPLVGAYSVHGFAHPGPLGFWIAAPLYRLSGENPISLLWTGAAVNVAATVALAAVAWRRGRWPLLLGTMLMVALLVRGLGPEHAVDIWNPYTGILPFLLTVFLVWDAGLGRPRAFVEAVIPASYAAQSHLAYVSLTALLGLWLLAWWRYWPQLLPTAITRSGHDDDADPDAEDEPRAPSRRLVVGAALVAVALWAGPLLDSVFDLHNPAQIAATIRRPLPTVGFAEAPGLVGRYLRLDGPWMGGAEPAVYLSLKSSGPVPIVLALAALVACVLVARRRGFVDVAALATLALTLAVGSVPAVSRIVVPNLSYLTEWLKLVGALVWFTVGWTLWRCVEPRVTATATKSSRQRLGLGAVAVVAVVGIAASSWGEARSLEAPHNTDGELIRQLSAETRDQLRGDKTYRVEVRGDDLSHFRGVIYWLIHDGFDVKTADGRAGLKWGRSNLWHAGDEVDEVLTVAVQYGGDREHHYADCLSAPSTRLVFDFDYLTAEERARLDDISFRMLADPESVTDADRREGRKLARDNIRLGIFAGPEVCGEEVRT